MEVNVNHSIELGPKTLAFFAALITGGAVVAASAEAPKAAAQKAAPAPKAETGDKTPAATPAPKTAAGKPATPAAKPATPATPAAKPATPATPAAKAKPATPAAKPVEVAFADLGEEDKLESLKAHVTRHTKKGKSADIKALLAPYGAERVSLLGAEWYDSFNEVLDRYSAGESVEDIFPSVD